MNGGKRVSTGLPGLDQAIDMLRIGDNVVWQVQALEEYKEIVKPYVRQAETDGRSLCYLRFGRHDPIIEDGRCETICMDATMGFERFTTMVHGLITQRGRGTFYVFDCLTDLLDAWHSDLVLGNFFRVICPYLYRMETIAYFSILRGVHTYQTIARIRETTQLLLDIYSMSGEMYIHPLKVWQRYSPTMFFPHLIKDGEAISITASAQSARLFALKEWGYQSQNQWERFLCQCRSAMGQGKSAQKEAREKLVSLLLAKDGRMAELCNRYFTLPDLLAIADREVSTGMIGGKSVGVLLARKILEQEWGTEGTRFLEPHDSYFLGSDIFYTYIVYNDCWDLRMQQKLPEGYFAKAAELRQALLCGHFPENIQEQFMEMLEHFGQSPIIVRSSSLQEDNFGNAFAGKYESVFCANQGTPEDRYRAFEQAVRVVYASTMNDDALHYRLDRNLAACDEQMAILVQRVSGDYYDRWFFPHVAGVGNSHNLYLWHQEMRPEDGMLRMVCGLGTRAVDRISGDYARLVDLGNPRRPPNVTEKDAKKYSQHRVDVLDLKENAPAELNVEDFYALPLRTDKALFFSTDREALRYYQELGRSPRQMPCIPDFKKMLEETDFAQRLTRILKTLERVYEYPVDIEYTVNFTEAGDYCLNLLQCRPLQIHALGTALPLPNPPEEAVLFSFPGNFMGGNVCIPFDYAIIVDADEYIKLTVQEQYAVASAVGELNERLKGKRMLLIGPGRWGTTTPSLGVPVHFAEISNMAAVCEYSYKAGGIAPDLSFGSHFFQDVVESNIFYAAIFRERSEVLFRAEAIYSLKNCLSELLGEGALAHVLHVAQFPYILYSNLDTQRVLCCRRLE